MKYTPRHSRLVAVLVAAISACASIQAQTAPSPAAPATTTTTTTTTTTAAAPEDEVVTLSPFEVSATAGTDSYIAETTLAGNRLSTDLRDIGSSVTVVTSQFLADTGATDNTSLLQRIGGTEVGGVNGNYASPGPGTSSALLTEDTIHPSEDTRIRGLAAADNTHDFFLSDIPGTHITSTASISHADRMRFSLVKAVPPASSMPAARVPNSPILETSTCALAAGAAPARAWITISKSCLARSPSGSTSCTTTKNMNRSRPIRRTSAYPVHSASSLLS